MASHVSDGIRDEEGRDLLVALLHKVLHTILEDSKPTHTSANKNSSFGQIKLAVCISVVCLVQACLLEGLLGGNN